MPTSAGTVSKILWHFTGGPRWNEAEQRQEKRLKPMRVAYNALIKILESKELRIGQYREVIKAPIEFPATASPQKSELDYLIIDSMPVVCLADIPIIHLGYHAKRYGKIAIGFYRHSAIRHGFSPVFYQYEDSNILDAILHVYSGIKFSYPDGTISDHMKKAISSKNPNTLDTPSNRGELVPTPSLEELELRSIKSLLQFSEKALNEVLAYVKTFTIKEFDTIYCEREWRSIKPFNFDYSDVAMIVVPRKVGNGRYFERFIDTCTFRDFVYSGCL